jgi:hypothetical protein
MKEIELYAHSDVLIFIIDNKYDSEERINVFLDAGNDFAEQIKVPFIKTSAKNETCIKDCFNDNRSFIKKYHFIQERF